MDIINKDFSLNTRKFEINGNLYEISSTNHLKLPQTVDKIINRTNGNIAYKNRLQLKEMLEKFNAKFVITK